MAQGTMKAVVTAMIANAVLTVFKFAAALVTHSASMMNEAIHSLMDSLNQAFLYFGLRAARKPPDREYAFGHGQKKFLWNLWSAIGLFSIGCGLGLSHAWHSWSRLSHKQPPAPLELFGIGINPLWIAGVVLVIAFLLDGYSLIVAVRELKKQMQMDGAQGLLRYIVKSDHPTLVAVVLEDTIATVGVLLAAAGITLSVLFDNPVWDIVFSAMIALLLGIAAFFLGKVNMRFLTDVRDTDAEEAFAQVVREHHEVERYHDLRSIILDDEHTILVAEIELREEALVAGLQPRMLAYEQQYLDTLPEARHKDGKLQDYCRSRAAAQATLERTELVIEQLAAAVRKKLPRIHHVTIEIEGIATSPVASTIT
ncbi:MAG: cation diffusion facilitator family transporter [Pseudomonadota bacterium]|nr:cation diffusion facilitator family transporter [Pseudomonadota bacterium]